MVEPLQHVSRKASEDCEKLANGDRILGSYPWHELNCQVGAPKGAPDLRDGPGPMENDR